MTGGGAKALRKVAVTVLALALTGCGGCGKKDDAPDAQAFLAALMDAGDAGKGDAGVDDTAMPATNDPDLEQRMKHLLEAIAQNNPDLAGDALFPRDGFALAKEAADPQKVWDKSIQTSFKRSIEVLHNRFKGVEHAKYVSFEIGHSIKQLPIAKKNYKKPLWSVSRSKIRFTIDGSDHTLEIAQMVAWRGAWYVTHLR